MSVLVAATPRYGLWSLSDQSGIGNRGAEKPRSCIRRFQLSGGSLVLRFAGPTAPYNLVKSRSIRLPATNLWCRLRKPTAMWFTRWWMVCKLCWWIRSWYQIYCLESGGRWLCSSLPSAVTIACALILKLIQPFFTEEHDDHSDDHLLGQFS